MKRARAFRIREDRNRHLVETTHDIFWVWDIQRGKLEFLSPEFHRNFRDLIGFDENPKESLLRLVPLPDRNRVRRMLRRQAKGEETRDFFRVLRPSGAQAWINIRSFPWWSEDGRLLKTWGVAKDVSHRQSDQERLLTCQERLRHLALEQRRTEFRERKKLAAELHDRIAPTLFLANLKASDLKNRLTEPNHFEILGEIQKDLDQALKNIRVLFSEISSPILSLLGLPQALKSLAEEFQSAHGLRIVVRDNAEASDLDEELKDILYWSIRELMINTLKHAQATELDIHLRRLGSELRVSVQDDGIGFSPEDTFKRLQGGHGFGLFGIKERLEPLGGRMEIISRPGSGTRVKLFLEVSRDQIQGGKEL